jgi:hypothetical protein
MHLVQVILWLQIIDDTDKPQLFRLNDRAELFLGFSAYRVY